MGEPSQSSDDPRSVPASNAGAAAGDGRDRSTGHRGKHRHRNNRLTADELGFPTDVKCPFCNEHDTDLHAPFGSALSVATYWCNRCRTAFEWVKWDAR